MYDLALIYLFRRSKDLTIDVTVRRAILEDQVETRRLFLAKHGSHVERIIRPVSEFYTRLDSAAGAWVKGERTMYVHQFLHAAGNSLVQSTSLLIVGMGAASGNMMRHYAEATSMALLCAVPESGVLPEYMKDRKRYPIHKAVDRLGRAKVAAALQRLIGFDPEGWRRFKAQMDLFDNHSHSGAVSIGYHFRFGKKAGGLVIGGEYDPQKFKVYRHELKFRINAAKRLSELLRALDPVLRAAA